MLACSSGDRYDKDVSQEVVQLHRSYLWDLLHRALRDKYQLRQASLLSHILCVSCQFRSLFTFRGNIALDSTYLLLHTAKCSLLYGLQYSRVGPSFSKSILRGGVKITRVTPILDSGGCVEVRVATEANANQALDEGPGSFVKLCVPSISLVWHPFTVYKHANDPRTVRFLFRPVGPFTTKLAETLTAPRERPITILDGFYRGADRVGECLQHDHVTIVAGGVAITPFLSMIPAVLQRLASSKDHTLLKNITLHWACREHGLCDFVLREHLTDFLEQVKGALVDVTVKVYHTGNVYDCENTNILDSDSDPTMDSSGSSSNEVSLIDDTEEEETIAPSVEMVVSTVPSFNDGFDMEVARIMPGRFHNPLWNLPVLFWLGITIWLGYHIIIVYYNAAAESSNFIPARMWGTLLSFGACLGFAVGVEFAVLQLHQWWPSPKADEFIVSQYSAVGEVAGVEDETFEDDLVTIAETSERTPVVMLLEHAQGRPVVSEIFAEARKANAPAFFTCGPVALVKAISNEAGKENSTFGYTRYCIYDEPFEM